MVTSSVEVATEEEALSGNGGIYGIGEARLFRELEQGEWKGVYLFNRSLAVVLLDADLSLPTFPSDSAFERLVKRELDSAA